MYVFGDWRNDNHHAPIIERDLWDDVQAILAEPTARPPRKPKTEQVEEDPYRYYLQGRVRCPHCGGNGCAYTQGVAKTTHYYVCLLNQKRETKCPVGRVNADALHFTVLSLIERAARHHTIMHRLIAESGGWQSAPDELHSLRGQLAKRRQFIGVQKNNLTNLLADGRGYATLLDRLDKLENEERSVIEQLEAVEQDIAEATLKRPTADQVQAS